jgi:hypothetical protein
VPVAAVAVVAIVVACTDPKQLLQMIQRRP